MTTTKTKKPVYEVEAVLTFRGHILVEASSPAAAEKKLQKKLDQGQGKFVSNFMTLSEADYFTGDEDFSSGYEAQIK